MPVRICYEKAPNRKQEIAACHLTSALAKQKARIIKKEGAP